MENVLNQEFVEMLMSLPGHEDLPLILTSTCSPTSIRLNPDKDLSRLPQIGSKIPWEPYGRYLADRPEFTLDPALYDGRYYVQDASSMIIGEAIRRLVRLIDRPVKYLDACAAPGGKTTSAIANLPEGSFVLANEYDSTRVWALADNLERWGASNYAIGRNDARNLSKVGPLFDIVAADVPCSGEGMMRKNKTAISQWSKKLIEDCAALQREIVASLWETLIPGGYLIYSTCTFNLSENEKNAEWIRDNLGGIPIDLGLIEYKGVQTGVNTDIPCVRMLPGKVEGEGQFLVVFQKPEGKFERKSKKKSNIRFKTQLPDWLNGNFAGFTDKNDNIFAIREEFSQLVSELMSTVNIVVPGIHVGIPKGKNTMPAHALATSTALKDDAFPIVELDRDTALSFLRGEAIRLPGDTPLGYVLVQTERYRLGWVKNIGSRANNLIPANRRIRHQ